MPTLLLVVLVLLVPLLARCVPGDVHSGRVLSEDVPLTLTALDVGRSTFCSGVCRLRRAPRGTVPGGRSCQSGQELTVELVEWLAPVSLGVVGGPVPSSVPSGEGSVPGWPLGLLAPVGVGLLRRGMRAQA